MYLSARIIGSVLSEHLRDCNYIKEDDHIQGLPYHVYSDSCSELYYWTRTVEEKKSKKWINDKRM